MLAINALMLKFMKKQRDDKTKIQLSTLTVVVVLKQPRKINAQLLVNSATYAKSGIIF